MAFIREYKLLSIIFVLCCVVIALFDFIFDDTQELFRGGAKLAELASRIAISYFAGLVFFILTVHLPNMKKRKRTKIIVKEINNKLVFRINHFFRRSNAEFLSGSSQKLPSKNNVKVWCTSTGANESSCIGTSIPTQMMTYIEAIEHFLVKGIIEEIDRSSIFHGNVDPEYLEALYAVKRSEIIEYILDYSPSIFTWDKEGDLNHYCEKLVDLVENVERLISVTNKYYGKD